RACAGRQRRQDDGGQAEFGHSGRHPGSQSWPPFHPPCDLCYGQMSSSQAPRGVVSMSRMKPEDAIGAKARPFTGAAYLASLRDGREVYIYGERVSDVTEHPAFRNTARSLARLYDALHDPKTRPVLTTATDTGSGGYTHRYFRVARSREDVVSQRDA